MRAFEDWVHEYHITVDNKQKEYLMKNQTDLSPLEIANEIVGKWLIENPGLWPASVKRMRDKVEASIGMEREAAQSVKKYAPNSNVVGSGNV